MTVADSLPDFQLGGKDVQILKEGLQICRGIEKQAYFALTSGQISLIFSYAFRTELMTTFCLKSLYQIQRVASSGVFNTLQFIMVDGSSFCFKFDTEESQREVSRKLVRMRKFELKAGKTHASSLVYNKTLNPLNIFQLGNYTARWVDHQISTIDYLMTINALASRVGHQYQRHAIFPSVFTAYTSSKPSIQTSVSVSKFNKSMLSGKVFVNPEESSLWETGLAINYLERKHYYMDIVGEGGHFESCLDIKSASNKPTELIPEFYSEPSFLMGNKWRSPVVLPKFAQDPFSFVAMHRRALENDEVSDWLSRWIDSVFGVGSKAVNVSQTHTSESTLHFTQNENPDTRHIKLFSDLHPRRKLPQELKKKHFLDPTHSVCLYEPYSKLADSGLLLLALSWSSNKIAFVSRNRLLVYDSAITSKGEAKQDSPGLYVVQEATLSQPCITQLAKPYQFLWHSSTLVGASRENEGSIAVYDIVAGLVNQVKVASRTVTQLQPFARSGGLVAGTADGAITVVSFARSVPQIIASFSLDSLPLLGQVSDFYSRLLLSKHLRQAQSSW